MASSAFVPSSLPSSFFLLQDMERKTTDEKDNIQAQDGLSVGDVCETVMDMTLREGEDFKSNAVGQIPHGTQFEIVSVAPANRVKVLVPDTVLEGFGLFLL